MSRRLGTATVLALAGLLALAPGVGASAAREPEGPTTTTTITEGSTTTVRADLPATTLEAEQRDDGSTSAARWAIGSGVAAAVTIAVGGTILKRRSGDRRGH